MMPKLANRSQDLEDAFHVFSQMSERLAESYRLLEDRVAVLTEELAAARHERLLQLAEKERLANRLQLLLEALPGGVVVTDGQGLVQECNPAATALLGEPLLKERWTDVAVRTFATGPHQRYEATLKDGRQLSISSCELETEPGRIILFQDVTETRQLQDLLSRHQRLSAMGEMVARLAHQIRTPLASAMLYVSMLDKAPAEHGERAQCAGKILSRMRELERMVNDMLVFARGGDFAAQPVTLSGLLDDVRQALELQLQQCKGRLDIVDMAPGASIEGVRDVLLGALLNLATNAIQAKGDQVRLKIETRRDALGAIEVRVSDNGPGVPQELQEKIFEPFFTTRSSGTGLGLAVVRAVMEGHRGEITLEPAPIHGASFILKFPAQSGEQALSSGLWYGVPSGSEA